jgi:hypothetical protein
MSRNESISVRRIREDGEYHEGSQVARSLWVYLSSNTSNERRATESNDCPILYPINPQEPFYMDMFLPYSRIFPG